MSAKPQGKAKNRAAAKPKASAKAKHAVANGNGIAPAVLLDDELQRQRNELGQFTKGDIGGPGRPPGRRNKLTDDFISDFHNAWKQHGASALQKMATEDQGAFVRAAVQLMPKDVLVDARGVGLVVVRLDDVDMKL